MRLVTFSPRASHWTYIIRAAIISATNGNSKLLAITQQALFCFSASRESAPAMTNEPSLAPQHRFFVAIKSYTMCCQMPYSVWHGAVSSTLLHRCNRNQVPMGTITPKKHGFQRPHRSKIDPCVVSISVDFFRPSCLRKRARKPFRSTVRKCQLKRIKEHRSTQNIFGVPS